MKTSKKMLSLLLIAAMLVSVLCMGVSATGTYDEVNTSGWMYKVNGWFPNYGCSRYQLKDGDVIEWVYTCDLGKDVGGDYWNKSE